MDPLTGKQKRLLLGLGRKLPVTVSVGKAGLSAGLTRQVRELIARRELVKVRLGAGAKVQREAQAAELAEAVGVAIVGLTGRTVLLHRPSGEPDPR